MNWGFRGCDSCRTLRASPVVCNMYALSHHLVEGGFLSALRLKNVPPERKVVTDETKIQMTGSPPCSPEDGT